MNILILREADIRRACTMPEAIDAACEALRLYSTGVCDIPLRTTIAVPEGPGSSLYMYGYAAPAGALGVKIVSSFPENAKRGLPSTPSTMVLLDAQTGAVCALLDGTYFTRLRTGALAGAATRLLAREDSRVFTIYGTGGQALEQIEAVLAVRPIERVQIVGRSRDKAAALARKVQAAHGAFCTADVPADEAAANADIITAVTGAYTPLFDGALVRPGTHINGIGSCTPQQAELDAKLIARAGMILSCCEESSPLLFEASFSPSTSVSNFFNSTFVVSSIFFSVSKTIAVSFSFSIACCSKASKCCIACKRV